MVKAYHILLVVLSFFLLSNLSHGQVTVKYSDEAGNQGDTVVVDVTVDGFVDVRNFNFISSWDTTLLSFVDIDSVNETLPISNFSFGTPNGFGKKGRVTVLFFQGDFINYNLGPNDILFSFSLRVISAECITSQVDTLDILPKNEFVRLENGDEVKITPGSSPGEIEINPGCAAGNQIGIGTVIGMKDEEICVPVTGRALSDMGGFNGLLLNFDPNVLSYNRVENKTGPQGEPIINENMAATGQLEMIYSYIGGGGAGLTTDSTVLFCLCFDVIGDCESSSVLNLSKGPNYLMINSNGVEINSDLDDGSVAVNCCSISAMMEEVSCFDGDDGSITLTPQGCENITEVVWSNTTQTGLSISGLSAGTYDATVTYDGGASTRIVSNIIVGEADEIVEDGLTINHDSGAGDGSISIEIQGGTPPLNYSWSNGADTEDISSLPPGSYTLTVTDANDCVQVFGPYIVSTAPTITGVITNVMCFGENTGSVDITVAGGTPPYSYSWSCPGTVDSDSGDISDVGATTCTVTVTDAGGATAMETFVIEGPNSPLTATIANVMDDVTNDGSGSISLNVSGGWGNYEFNWNDGSVTMYPSVNPLENLFGGNYNVTVTDDMGCEVQLGPIEVEGLRVAATNIEAVQCFGDNNGAINIVVMGGSGNYDFNWSCSDGIVDTNGNISGLTSGECTVVVTDLTENRMTSATFVVPGPTSALTVNVTEEQCVEVDDGILNVDVTGGVLPYSYSWNTSPVQTTPQASNLPSGEYSVLVTDSVGCQVMGLATLMGCDEQDCFTAMDVITPNGDGKNDRFIIDCASSSSNKLYIFTRWGQEVISFDNYSNDWEGTDDGGNLVDEDTYMWVLEVTSSGNTTLYKGAVSVIYNLR